MAIEPDIQEVPPVAWEYYGIVEFMRENTGLYSMDWRRKDCHDRLCSFYKISKDTSKIVTDHLDKYESAARMHHALRKLRDSK